MAPLNRAFALAQRDDVAVMIAEDLNLDMARTSEIFLEKDAAIAEGRLGLARGGFERGFEAGRIGDDAHPAATATSGGLYQNWKTGLCGELARRGQLAGIDAGDDRDFGVDRDAAGGDLVAERRHHIGWRADEDHIVGFDRARKFGALREEAVTRMNGVGAGGLRRADNRVDIEVAGSGFGRSDQACVVGCGDVRRTGVGLRIDRDGLDSEHARAANYPQCDFATIGDEQFPYGSRIHSVPEPTIRVAAGNCGGI